MPIVAVIEYAMDEVDQDKFDEGSIFEGSKTADLQLSGQEISSKPSQEPIMS